MICFSKVCFVFFLIGSKIQTVTEAFKNPYNLPGRPSLCTSTSCPVYSDYTVFTDSSKFFELSRLHTFIHFCFLFQNVLSPLPAKHPPKPHLKQVSSVELYPFVSTPNKLFFAFGTNNQLWQLRCSTCSALWVPLRCVYFVPHSIPILCFLKALPSALCHFESPTALPRSSHMVSTQKTFI